MVSTGKYSSEALNLESVNPHYDKRLLIEFPKNTTSPHLWSYFGLTDARMRASEKDLHA